MPIYEYHCKACGQNVELLQGFNEKPITKCPECGKSKLEQLVSAPSFHLKGTGWYVTDFKNSGKKEPSKESEKPAAKTDDKKTT